MMSAAGLSKTYGDRQALTGLDMVVEDGAVVGLVGPNGAGKSTVMKLLAGLIQPTSGHVHIDGISVGQIPVLHQS
jgi:ABC-2 type transport system ATP-binding protein